MEALAVFVEGVYVRGDLVADGAGHRLVLPMFRLHVKPCVSCPSGVRGFQEGKLLFVLTVLLYPYEKSGMALRRIYEYMTEI
jgi:hypothetical protein